MRIRISNQGEPSRIESFEHKSEIRIGRVPTNDLVLAERGISSNHARLVFDHSGQLYIEDLGSTNGTFVNGQRIQGARAIGLYDEVYVCHIKIEIAVGDQQFPPEPPQAPVQTGATQMASPEQAEALRRARGTLSGEIGGGGGAGPSPSPSPASNGWGGQAGADPQGQWNQQGQWGQETQQGYGAQGQWDQGGYDPQGQWNQQQQQGYDQQGYDQQGYDQQGYDQQGYGQQGYDQQQG